MDKFDLTAGLLTLEQECKYMYTKTTGTPHLNMNTTPFVQTHI